MPALVIQILQVYANLVIIVFVGYYFFKLWKKEHELEKREQKADNEYHHVVNEALAKERKIVDDATHEAEQIIAGAYYVNKTSKETVEHALQTMIADIQKDAVDTAHDMMTSYQASLRELTSNSLTVFDNVAKEQHTDYRRQLAVFKETLTGSLEDFQNVAKGMEQDLQEQIMAFHKTLLPIMQKELDEYKKSRMEQTEQAVVTVVQKVSQEVLNKSFSLDDHEQLLLNALEKAKKEGLFT